MKKIVAVIVIAIIVNISPAIAEIKITIQSNDLPLFFSWRDINGTDFTTPVKNQAPAPTCEAYALVAAMETLMQYQTDSLFEPDLSETHLYFYAGGTYEAGYVNLIDAANYLIEHGVPDEGCYPDPHRPFDYPYESLSGWQNRTVKIMEWGWVEQTEDAIKRALIENGPLIICLYFGNDFYYYRGGVYKHRWGRIAGGHVVTMMGYDDNEQCWIVKNSWGREWGEDGWFRLAYDANLFADWYGEGTGVMYINNLYGNFIPDVPRIQITQPRIYHTYLFGFEYPSLLRNLPFIQEAAARIIGTYTVKLNATNTNKVEFYLDGKLESIDEEQPYEWNLRTSLGIHTIEIVAYNEKNVSKEIMDTFVLSSNHAFGEVNPVQKRKKA
jgi:hypothetical protein